MPHCHFRCQIAAELELQDFLSIPSLYTLAPSKSWIKDLLYRVHTRRSEAMAEEEVDWEVDDEWRRGHVEGAAGDDDVLSLDGLGEDADTEGSEYN